MSSVAEGVSKHISREPGVNLNRKAFFLKMHKMLCLIFASCLGNTGFHFGPQSPAPMPGPPARLSGDGAPPTGHRCEERPA